MPIYEYHCRGCGQDFETLVRGAETPACTHCSGHDLEKKLSVFAAPGSQPDLAVAPCGTCGNPGGPGSCAFN